MDARPLHVFHDPGDQHVIAVGYDVEFEFDPVHVFVDEDGTVDARLEDRSHVFPDLVVGPDDPHVLPADDVRRTEKDGITELVCGADRLFRPGDAHAFRSLYSERTEKRVETLAVFRRVDALRRRAENSDSA